MKKALPKQGKLTVTVWERYAPTGYDYDRSPALFLNFAGYVQVRLK